MKEESFYALLATFLLIVVLGFGLKRSAGGFEKEKETEIALNCENYGYFVVEAHSYSCERR